MKNEEVKYSINSEVVKNYVETLNSITEPMSKIKEEMQKLAEPMNEISKRMTEIVDGLKPISEECVKNINAMAEELKKYSYVEFGEQTKVMTDAIKQLMEANNGVLTSRMIEPLNISRQYLSIMEDNKKYQEVYMFLQKLLMIVIIHFNVNIKRLFFHI